MVERIEVLLKKKGITRKQFAESLGIGKNQLKKWETGESKPNLATILGIASYLDTTPEYLTGEANSLFEGTSETAEKFLSSDEQNIIYLYRSLNDEGKEKAADYLDDLVQSGKYIKSGTLLVDKKEG
jgi:transcriptional regulator with XRE-family HTH domain